MPSLHGFVAAGMLLVGTYVATSGPEPTPQLLDQGQSSYMTNCQGCHGSQGKGDAPSAAMMRPKPTDLTAGNFKHGGTPDALFQTISNGIPGTTMLGFRHLPENERWALVYYVKSLGNKSG